MGRSVVLRSLLTAAFVLAPTALTPAHAQDYSEPGGACVRATWMCADVALSKQTLGYYTGHDEPSLLFYSDERGAGNNMVYRLQLPKDPPVRPTDNGSGGTWNFQLRPAFWVGMALCDTTSAPEFTNQCAADTDANIFDEADPASPRYIGKHPGTAFMELQFYPPSWVEWPAAQANAGGSSCDPTRWCAAMNVDSLLLDMNHGDPGSNGTLNNPDCRRRVGDETINFAFLTKNGRSIAPADPLIGFGTPGSPTFTPDPRRVTFFNSGDTLEIDLHDTAGGLLTTVHDLDSGATGSMTASIDNGFAHVLFQPGAAKCASQPYAFHPMYSTASEHTRVPWAAHSYNIAYSDEIGHFEFCPNVKNASVIAATGVCASASATDPAGADPDDSFCFTPGLSSLVRIGGCTNTDDEFDGPEYSNTWPGTDPNRAQDRRLHATPVRFTSPLIRGEKNFERVAYETDLPAIEGTCNPFTGAGCTNPPPGATFYPFFTTADARQLRRPNAASADGDRSDDDRSRLRENCIWQEGGAFLPNTEPGNFTSASAEFDGTFFLTFPFPPPFQGLSAIEDFRRIVPFNPCPAREGADPGN